MGWMTAKQGLEVGKQVSEGFALGIEKGNKYTPKLWSKCVDCGAATHSPRSSYCETHFDERLKLKILED